VAVYGEYNELGYRVLDGDTVLLVAGNHKTRPRAVVDPGSPEAMCVSLIRRYCAKATREFAINRRISYAGVRRV
jgi:hypothetical protein